VRVEGNALLGLGAVVVLGVGCQWLARATGLPAIVLLLLAGLVAGPLTGIVDPAALLGSSLSPLLSLAVGVLLFEGGLTLRLRELREDRGPVLLLVTVGVALTFALATVTVRYAFGAAEDVALIMAATLVVSGPTVIGPLLAQARVERRVDRLLRWEAIVIDPIGATLTVVVFGALVRHDSPVAGVLRTASLGIAIGGLAAVMVVLAMRLRLLPSDLEVPVVLLFVVAAFAGAESIAAEAGLFATTTLGIALGNQRAVSAREFEPFYRSVGTLLVGSLFILVGATIDPSALRALLPAAAVLVAILVVLVRPLVALLSTARSGLHPRQRAYVALLAPRGVVAAATASLFAVRLEEAGRSPGHLAPGVFLVILGTCAVYGLLARRVAELLGVSRATYRALALVGSAPWLRDLARELRAQGVEVKMVAPGAIATAEPGLYAGPLAELDEHHPIDEVAEVLLAAEDSDQNLLASLRYTERLGREKVVVLPPGRPLPQESQAARLAVRHRPRCASPTTADVEAAFARGSRFWTVEVPAAGARSWRPPGLVLARVRPGGDANLLPHPRSFRPGDRVVLLGAPCSRAGSASLEGGRARRPGG
jgi:NhaP-type Na+/H+ or K+/H+ antiporter